jgi:DNA-binding IclR family transcriptional regulator
LSLQQLSSQLELVPSTCLYILRALVEEELVAVDPDTKRYSLEAGILSLARHWLRRNQFTDLSQPVLDNISRARDVTMMGVHIVSLDHIVVVATSQAGNNFQISAQIGSRFPALISATGRCIAAFSDIDETELKSRFKTLRWDVPPSWNEWKAQVNDTRQRGIAIDEGNYIAGVTVLAAPVWKAKDKLSHALVALSIGSALKRNGLTQLENDLTTAAQSLSDQLCGNDRP